MRTTIKAIEKTIMKSLFLFAVLTAAALLSASCKTQAKYVKTDPNLVADSGVVSRSEMSRTAAEFAGQIAGHFASSDTKKSEIFVALLPTKNDTSEQIQVSVFDNRIVSDLLGAKIFTVRTESRADALKEIQFSQAGFGDGSVSVGKMKSPNYFVKTVISENRIRSAGKVILEHTIFTELINVETQISIWNGQKTFTKQIVANKGSVGW